MILKQITPLLLTVFVALGITSMGLSQNDCKFDAESGTYFGPDCPNAIPTAVPYLRIATDARTGGMGDMGVATSADANGIFYNGAKLAFAEHRSQIAVNYTPWLRDLVKDIYLLSAAGYLKLDDLQTVTASLRYFNLGEIQFRNASGDPLGIGQPYELDVSLGYARKLSEKFSLGVTGRFIASDLAGGQSVNNIDIKTGTAGAVDLTMYYETETANLNKFSWGVAITNIGTKITYTDIDDNPGDFLPTNLGVGAAYTLQLDAYNSLTIGAEFNKLLVPTPDTTNADGNSYPDYREESVISGMFKSFGDAPTFEEEIKEITASLGLEYWYNDQFALRAGYAHEAETKGNRRHITFGAGLRYEQFGIDFSYLVNANGQQSPLNNTFRISLRVNFERAGDNG